VDWEPTFSFEVGQNWTTGVYVVKLTDTKRGETYVPFVVKSPPRYGTILLHTNELSWVAYNGYGGSSVYRSSLGGFSRAYKASADRPFQSYDGASLLMLWELPMIRLLESRGEDVDYAGDLDIHHDGDLLLRHKVVITSGHGEYWTRQMRDNMERARDAGVSLAFFGANLAYWQVRLEPNGKGEPDRVVVVYKDAKLDPLKDKLNVTVRFRQAPINRPEEDLLGVQYTAYGLNDTFYPLTFTANASRVFRVAPAAGTVSRGVVGNEWDMRHGAYPPGLIVLASSDEPLPVGSKEGQTSHQETTIYRAESGAYVFATGTLAWNLAFEAWPNEAGMSKPDSNIYQMTVNVLELMKGSRSVLADGSPLA
jgi:hypothetical protein